MRVRRAAAWVVAVMLLAGCGGNPRATKEQAADQTAAVLAASLSTGTIEGVKVRSGDPDEDLPKILAGMGGLLPTVTVTRVRHAGSSAIVDLAYAWPFSSPWTYETEAVIVEDGNDWQLQWKPSVVHPRLTETTRLERIRGELAERGNITGRGNTVLVQNLPMQLLGLNKAGLDAATVEASARRIAAAVSIDADAYAAKVRTAPSDAFVDAVPVRPAEVPAAFGRIRGAQQRTVVLPAAKSAGYARAVLGTVGYATPAQAEAAMGMAPGDIVGTSGLQKVYDSELRGSTGTKVFLTDRDSPVGHTTPKASALVADFPHAPGQSLETTLDDDIQTAAEDLLEGAAVPASVVVLHKDTGAILAAADSPLARRGNDSIEARFPPGLAAGPVAALALMRSGISLSERVACEPEVVIDGRHFANEVNYTRNRQRMTIADAIATNCVTAVARAATRVSPEKVTDAAITLGLATNYDIGIPLNFGAYPAPPDAVAKAEALVGEGGRGKVHVSPAALAAMAAAVDSSRTVVPHVIPGRDPQAGPAVPALSNREQRELRDLMEDGARSSGELVGLVTGESDRRTWAVGYTNSLAIAVVLRGSSAGLTPDQIVSDISEAGSVRQKPAEETETYAFLPAY